MHDRFLWCKENFKQFITQYHLVCGEAAFSLFSSGAFVAGRAEMGKLLDTFTEPSVLSQTLLETRYSAILPQSQEDFQNNFLSYLHHISQTNTTGNKFYQTGLTIGSWQSLIGTVWYVKVGMYLFSIVPVKLTIGLSLSEPKNTQEN